MSWFENLKAIFCPELQRLIEKNQLNAKINIDLIKRLDEFNKDKKHWDNKYPVVDITYVGRSIKGKAMRMDVRQFITPNNSRIINDVQRQNLVITNDKINLMVPKIYKRAMRNFDYTTDLENFGSTEFWLYVDELHVLKTGDCEDYSHKIASYFLSAGVPSWRVRIAVGKTRGGIGHSTVLVLADDLKNWYHLNSTSPNYVYRNWFDLTEFPSSKDESDRMGIKDYWFSFNHYGAWSAIKSEEALMSFDNEKAMNRVLINE